MAQILGKHIGLGVADWPSFNQWTEWLFRVDTSVATRSQGLPANNDVFAL
jgi:hypothetical protein